MDRRAHEMLAGVNFDIALFGIDALLYYIFLGSLFVPNGKREEIPVASSMTVEMRQYGDKESAAEVLAIRNDGYLPSTAKVSAKNRR